VNGTGCLRASVWLPCTRRLRRLSPQRARLLRTSPATPVPTSYALVPFQSHAFTTSVPPYSSTLCSSAAMERFSALICFFSAVTSSCFICALLSACAVWLISCA
jgi:hypothetical protein